MRENQSDFFHAPSFIFHSATAFLSAVVMVVWDCVDGFKKSNVNTGSRGIPTLKAIDQALPEMTDALCTFFRHPVPLEQCALKSPACAAGMNAEQQGICHDHQEDFSMRGFIFLMAQIFSGGSMVCLALQAISMWLSFSIQNLYASSAVPEESTSSKKNLSAWHFASSVDTLAYPAKTIAHQFAIQWHAPPDDYSPVSKLDSLARQVRFCFIVLGTFFFGTLLHDDPLSFESLDLLWTPLRLMAAFSFSLLVYEGFNEHLYTRLIDKEALSRRADVLFRSIQQKLNSENSDLNVRNIFANPPGDSNFYINPDFVCPITRCVMDDPVSVDDGYCYDRSAIQEWYRLGNRSCPLKPSALLVNPRFLSSNDALRHRIESDIGALPTANANRPTVLN